MDRLRRAGKIGIAVFFAAILAISGIVYYLKTAQAQQMILARVNAVIPGSVHLKSVRFSVISGTFEVNHLSLLSPSGEEVFGCKRLSGNVEWKALRHRVFSIADLLMEAPRADIRRDHSGNIDLIQAVSPPETNIPEPSEKDLPPAIIWSTVIKSARISNGTLRFKDERQNVQLNIRGVDAAATADILKQTGGLTFSCREGDIHYSRFKTKLNLLKVASTYRKDRLDPIAIECGGSFGKAMVAGWVNHLSKIPELDLSLELITDAASLKSDLGFQYPLDGRITTRATIRGSANNPRLSCNSDISDGDIAGVRLERAQINVDLENRMLRITAQHVQSSAGTLRFSAGIDMKSAFPDGFLSPIRDLEAVAYAVQLEARGVDLSKLAVQSPGLIGSVDAEITLQGKGTDPQSLSAQAALDFTAKGLSTRFNAAPVDVHLQTKTFLDNGAVRLENFLARIGDIRLRADGQLELASKTASARLSLDAPNLERNLSPLGISDVRGDLYANAELNGSVDAPTAFLSLNGKSLAIKNIRLGNMAATLRRKGQDLYIDRLELQNRNSAVSASGSARLFEAGSFTLFEDPRIEANIKGDALFLEDFVDSLNGKLSVSARLGGTVKQPKGQVTVQGDHLDLALQKLEGLHLEADLDNETVRISALEITPVPGESVTGSGWISFQKSFEFHMATEGVSLRHIDLLREPEYAQGILVFDLTGRGSLDNPQVQGNISVKQLRVNDKPVDDITLRLDLKDQTARIFGKLNFDIDSTYHLQKKDFSISLSFDQTELSPYFGLVDRKELSGILTGKIHAAGNAGAVRGIRTAADVSRLDIFLNDRKLIDTKPFSALMENEEIVIPGLDLVLADEGNLSIKGQAKLSGPLALEATGNIPLKVLHLFVDAIPDVTGDILLAARVQGTAFEPRITADLNLENVGFTVPGIQQELHDVTGQVRITPQAVTLHDLQGYLDTGLDTNRIDLSGRIGLKSFYPTDWDLALNAPNLPVRVPDTLNLILATDLKFAGSPSKSSLDGEVILLEGDYYKDVNLSLTQAVTQKQRESLPAPAKPLPDFLKNMDFNISLGARKPFLVDNNLALLEIKPDLHLSGKPDNPVISGRAVVESGTIEFRKNTFAVKKGVVDFISPYRIEPFIDIESDTQVRDWTVRLKLSGPPDELAVQLTSEPVETEEDIISLLLFRKTTRELIEKDGGMAKSTGQMMTQIIAETFGEDIKKTTGLDIFEIGTAGSGSDTDPNRTTLTMGKELSRRLTLKYALDTQSGEMVQRAITEYKLLENILIDGFQDSQGIFGGGVKFRLEFR
ncbi:MAG: translocation/assembly module TamB domain-containing protein [Pseudomonadota bacterium]